MLVVSLRQDEGVSVGTQDRFGPHVELMILKVEGKRVRVGILADTGPDQELLPVRRELHRLKPSCKRKPK